MSVCPLCGRTPLDVASPAERASGLVCTPACTRQRDKRGPLAPARASRAREAS